MNDKTVVQLIDELIFDLSIAVSASEALDGWTPESKKAIKSFLEDLKTRLQSNEPLPRLNISRALDHWGVVGGEILERAAQISNRLRLEEQIKNRP